MSERGGRRCKRGVSNGCAVMWDGVTGRINQTPLFTRFSVPLQSRGKKSIIWPPAVGVSGEEMMINAHVLHSIWSVQVRT